MIVLVISKINYGFFKLIINATVFMIEISSEKKKKKKRKEKKQKKTLISVLSISQGGTVNCLCVYESRSVVSDSLRLRGLYSPWKSPGQNTGVSSLSLFQGIFPNQGSNPCLPHCRQFLYQLSHQGIVYASTKPKGQHNTWNIASAQ